jgi:DNA-binding NarL/FixJ family response regulator
MIAQQVNGATGSTEAAVTLSKYRNQMAWRRNKVKELLARGYRQHDIANTLHTSQPTISGDIYIIFKWKCAKVQKITTSIELKFTETAC